MILTGREDLRAVKTIERIKAAESRMRMVSFETGW